MVWGTSVQNNALPEFSQKFEDECHVPKLSLPKRQYLFSTIDSILPFTPVAIRRLGESESLTSTKKGSN